MARVLIVSAHARFGEAVEAWLRQQRDLDVIGWEAETGTALAHIQQLEPDVIVLDTATFSKSPIAALMKLIADGSDSQIIGLDLRNNSVTIYGGEQRAATQLRELLNVLGEQGMACTKNDEGGSGRVLDAHGIPSVVGGEVK